MVCHEGRSESIEIAVEAHGGIRDAVGNAGGQRRDMIGCRNGAGCSYHYGASQRTSGTHPGG